MATQQGLIVYQFLCCLLPDLQIKITLGNEVITHTVLETIGLYQRIQVLIALHRRQREQLKLVRINIQRLIQFFLVEHINVVNERFRIRHHLIQNAVEMRHHALNGGGFEQIGVVFHHAGNVLIIFLKDQRKFILSRFLLAKYRR